MWLPVDLAAFCAECRMMVCWSIWLLSAGVPGKSLLVDLAAFRWGSKINLLVDLAAFREFLKIGCLLF